MPRALPATDFLTRAVSRLGVASRGARRGAVFAVLPLGGLIAGCQSGAATDPPALGATVASTASPLHTVPVPTHALPSRSTRKNSTPDWTSSTPGVCTTCADNTCATAASSIHAFSWGDPHLSTFDGLRYDFQGAGEFFAVLDRNDPTFAIQLRSEPFAKSRVAFGVAMAMSVAGDRVSVVLTDPIGTVHVNGATQTVDATAGLRLPNGGTVAYAPIPPATAVSIVASQPALEITWPTGETARVSNGGIFLNIDIWLTTGTPRVVGGILGNIDGDPTDDLTTRGGVLIAQPPSFSDLYNVFGDSWRISQSESLFDYGPGESTATFTNLLFPFGVATFPPDILAAALQTCEAAGITDAVTLDACVLDVAATGEAALAAAAAANVPPVQAGIANVAASTGQTYQITQGTPGSPNVVGCSDGQREGLVDQTRFPHVAACLGTWTGGISLRAPTTGVACGDDTGPCAVPADICAPGWHVCGTSGDPAELLRLSATDCAQAGGGIYMSALSYCASDGGGCTYATSPAAPYGCTATGTCSESACCGVGCSGYGLCLDAVWTGATHAIADGDGCGAAHARTAGGVLCCDSGTTPASTGLCGPSVVVDDGNPCTRDSCDPVAGVEHIPVPGEPCSDGNACNGLELCNAAGTCSPGVPPQIDDGNPCTLDSCDPIRGLVHTPEPGASCADGNICDGPATCSASGICVHGAPPVINDGNACTVDTCDSVNGVQHTPVNDDDGNPCTTDSCNPLSGVSHVSVTAGTNCSDGNPCDGARVCDGTAQCLTQSAPVLSDGNACTLDTCDPSTGTVSHTPIPGCATSAREIAAGGSHSCEIKSDGSLGCWGDNSESQSSPETGTTFTQISAGYDHTCGLKPDGTVLCWGDSADGELAVPPTDRFAQVSAGYRTTCALRAGGTISCWGFDAAYAPPSGGLAFTSLSLGSGGLCGVRTDGSVTCNSSIGGPPDVGPYTSVSVGQSNACAIRSADGAVVCWGDPANAIVTPPPGLLLSQVSVSNGAACGLTPASSIVCWGESNAGELSPPSTGTFTRVSAGYRHACAVRSDGSVSCWGDDTSGQAPNAIVTDDLPGAVTDLAYWSALRFGPPYTVASATFEIVSGTLPPGLAMSSSGTFSGSTAVAGAFSFALSYTDGNGFSATQTYTIVATAPLGNGQSCTRAAQCVSNSCESGFCCAGTSCTALSAGVQHVCELTAAGVSSCWGDNGSGQGSAPTSTSFTQLSAGRLSTCGLNASGVVKCWGQQTPLPSVASDKFIQISNRADNVCGVHADGTVNCTSMPAALTASSLFASMQTGIEGTCGLKTDGSIVCSGINGAPTSGVFTQLSVGLSGACAVRADSAVVCWGGSAPGILTAPTDDSFASVSVGEDFACAVDSAGAIRCWGSNSYGQLAAPAGIFLRVDASDRSACAVRSDKVVLCWGDDTEGQAPFEITPVQLPHGTVGVAYSFTLGFGPVYSAPGASLGVQSGSVPPGLVLQPNGTFSGTPSGAGTYTFTARYTDSNGFLGTRTYAVEIDAPLADNALCTNKTQCASGTCVGNRCCSGVACTSVTVGRHHACEVKGDGSASCWGLDSSHQCDVPSGTTFQQLVAAGNDTCGVRTDGSVACWGADGANGAPTLGTFAQVSGGPCFLASTGAATCAGTASTVSTPSGDVFSSISSNSGSLCGIRPDGSIECVGITGAPTSGRFVQLSVGFDADVTPGACAVRDDGQVFCWAGTHATQNEVPSGVTFTAVSSGGNFNCGITTAGMLQCWGENDASQLSAPPGSFMSVSAGTRSACGVRSDGVVLCWGDDSTGAAPSELLPLNLLNGTVGVPYSYAMGFGPDYSVAGAIYLVAGGQLPPGLSLTAIGQLTGTPTAAGTFAFTAAYSDPNGFNASAAYSLTIVNAAVDGTFCTTSAQCASGSCSSGVCCTGAACSTLSVGYQHVCQLLAGGVPSCWGDDSSHQCEPPTGETFVQVAAGGGESCGLHADGSVRCWGTSTALNSQPGEAYSQISTALDESGLDEVCGLRSDGTVHCWNAMGPLSPPLAQQVLYASASYSGGNVCGLRPNGTIDCAGYIDTPTTGVFTQVSAGSASACAVRSDGAVVCWGDNTGGKATPPTGTTFKSVAVGSTSACAVSTAGAIQCWGANDAGQTSAPTGTFTRVAVGHKSACAVRSDNSIACWGDNVAGEAPSLITPGSLFSSAVGAPYSSSFAFGPPYSNASGTFTVSSGQLPTGLTLSASGSLTGTASAAGTYGFAVAYADGNGFSSSKSYSVTITPAVANGQPCTTGSQCSSGTCGSGVCCEAGACAALTVGYGQTCELKVDGTASCWGDDTHQQCDAPVGAHYVQLAIGFEFSCGLHSDGTIGCWGAAAPTGMSSTDRFLSINADGAVLCATRTDGAGLCWSSSGSQTTLPGAGLAAVAVGGTSVGGVAACSLGRDNSLSCVNLPVSAPSGSFTQVAAGLAHACALRSDGAILCWGDNTYGQTAAPTGQTYLAVAAGDFFSCGLTSTGGAVCWGMAAEGELLVPAGSFVRIAAGHTSACAMTAANNPVCWGDNTLGEAPAGFVPSNVLGATVGVPYATTIAFGPPYVSTSALYGLTTGEAPPGIAFAAGAFAGTPTVAGAYPMLVSYSDGNGFAVSRTYSIPVSNPLADGQLCTQSAQCASGTCSSSACCTGSACLGITVGSMHACELLADGTASCWGDDVSGQSDAPLGDHFVQLSAGGSTTCGLHADGTFVCWGSPTYATAATTDPIAQLAVGDSGACFLRASGKLSCLGAIAATPPPATERFSFGATGQAGSCGLKPDGTVECWGIAGAPTTGTYTEVSAGYSGACALRTDGVAICWGGNNANQLQVPTGVTFSYVAAGGSFNCGLTTAGAVQCWGDDSNGELNVPTGVFTRLAAGDASACAIRSDGVVLCWGDDFYNQAPPKIAPIALPAAVAGAPYSNALPIGTELATPSYSLRDGQLPSGLTLSSAGTLAGTATAVGSYAFTVVASAPGQHVDTQPFTLQVTPPRSNGQVCTSGAQCASGTCGSNQCCSGAGCVGISMGGQHACELRPTGTVSCWGSDASHESDVPAGVTFTQVAAGSNFTCGLVASGGAQCWGDGAPAIPPTDAFVQLSAGTGTVCGLRANGTTGCWGTYAIAAPPANTPELAVVAGNGANCVIRPDGSIQCFGLGGAPVTGSYSQISVGAGSACAVRADGALVCWGDNTSGKSTPPSDTTYSAVSVGATFACALTQAGSVECWGASSAGQLAVPTAGTFVRVATSGSSACALRQDGALFCWGDNTLGEAPSAISPTSLAPGVVGVALSQVLAFGPPYANSAGTFSVSTGSLPTGLTLTSAGLLSGTPTASTTSSFSVSYSDPNGFVTSTPYSLVIQSPLADGQTCTAASQCLSGTCGSGVCCTGAACIALSVGYQHACELRPDGSVSCWGHNDSGQCNVPVGDTFTQVSAGRDETCGLHADGSIRCWGGSATGELTVPTTDTYSQVSAGAFTTCALRASGTIGCWGTQAADIPTATELFTSLSAGDGGNCGLKANGSVECWGITGAPIMGAYTQVSTGGNAACAVRSDGAIVCWGDNTSGKSTPPTDTTFMRVSVGETFACAVTTAGALRCWGDNSAHQLTAPTGTFTRVGAGNKSACAVASDGSIQCWGDDAVGEAPADIATIQLPDASVALPYSFVATFGGYGSGTYSMTSGQLPAGLALDASGVLHGTPSTPGSFTFSMAYSSASSTTVVQPYALQVKAQRADGTQCTTSAQCTSGTCASNVCCTGSACFAVAVGGMHACELHPDGSVSCWGDNTYGQSNAPTGELFQQVSTGQTGTCGVHRDGTIHCWGTDATLGVPVADTFVQVSSGQGTVCAIRTNGTLACWGPGAATVPTTSDTFLSVSTSSLGTCGLRSDGSVACWAASSGGYFPTAFAGVHKSVVVGQGDIYVVDYNGSLTDLLSPGENGTLSTSTAYASVGDGNTFACGLTRAGALACWGANDNGQATPPSGTYSALAVGGTSACAVTSTGSVTCWGSNAQGQAPQAWTPTAILPIAAGSSISTTLSFGLPYYAASGRYSVASGALPPGLTLASNGALSGTGATAGTYAFSVVYSDNNGFAPSQAYSLTVFSPRSDGQACTQDSQCASGSCRGSACCTGVACTSVTVGDRHACSLSPTGDATCWGDDSSQQSDVPSGQAFVQLSAGGSHTCGLRADGTVLCWGANSLGQTTTANFTDFVQVTSGESGTCALRSNGRAVCWGSVAGAPSDIFVQVSVGLNEACGLHPDGSVNCWAGAGAVGQTYAQIGAGNDGGCGLIDYSGDVQCWGQDSAPYFITPAFTDDRYSAIAAGRGFGVCAIGTGGALRCRVNTYYGYGDPLLSALATPPTGAFARVAVGIDSGCAVRSDGAIDCWGNNTSGQAPGLMVTQTLVAATVGTPYSAQLPTPGTSSSPTGVTVVSGEVPPGLSVDSTGLLSGTPTTNGSYTFATAMLSASGTLAVSSFAITVAPPLADGSSCSYARQCQSDRCSQGKCCSGASCTDITAGDYHACTLDGTGHAYCWGADDSGQCDVPAGVTFVQLSAGGASTCGLHADGTIQCWGDDSENQLSVPTTDTFLEVSVGESEVCALRANGTVSCFGSVASSPFGTSTTFASVSAGFTAECAMSASGTYTCVGFGYSGTATVGQYSQVSAGDEAACALGVDGTLHCFGYNPTFGGTSPPSSGTFASVTVGGDHACALSTSGLAQCWGANFSGQLVAPSDAFTSISAGASFTCGLHADASVKCWGDNSRGQAPTSTAQQTLVSGIVGVPYGANLTVSAEGFVSPLANAVVVSGALPPGLSLNSATGALSGSPSVAGAYAFAVRGTDQYSEIDVAKYLLSVSPPLADGQACSSALACQSNRCVSGACCSGPSCVQVTSGTNFSCALEPSGSVLCWGDDSYQESEPPTGQAFVQLATGASHVCGLHANGTVACWGSNYANQLSVSPTDTYLALSASQYDTCGLRPDGTTNCWGSYGQVTHPSARRSIRPSAAAHTACAGSRATGQSIAPSTTVFRLALSAPFR